MPLGFDMIVTGSGEVIRREDVARVGAYLDEMEVGVKEGLLGRFSLQDIQASDLLATDKVGVQRSIRDAQIATTYRTLHLVTAHVVGAMMLNHLSRVPTYCAQFDTCRTGGNTWAASLGAALTVGRIGALEELQGAPEYQTERDEALYRDIYSHRDTRMSLLGRYAFWQTRRADYAVVGGLTSIESVLGVAIVKAAYLRPDAGRTPRQQHSSSGGWTVGADISTMVRRLEIVVPFRCTLTDDVSQIPNTGRSTWQLQAGVALGVRVFNRVF
jgi:hypothetical protein